MNDFSHTSLIIFFILHFGVFVARYQNTRHATPNTTEVGSKYSGSMSSSSQCIRTTTAASFLFKKLQSHENRDTATVKWASERDSTGSGPRVAGNIFCSPVPFWDASLCDLFPWRAEITRARRGHRGPTRVFWRPRFMMRSAGLAFSKGESRRASTREKRASSSRVSRRTAVMERRSGRTQP